MTGLKVLRCGPAVAVQDLGRPGLLEAGVSRGGAADLLAVHEGAALLRQSPDLAVLEMAGFGGTFEATGPLRIALTGAPMAAALDGVALTWSASYLMEPGQKLEIGGARRGTYGYLHLGGGIDTPPLLGSRATHLAAGLGCLLAAGDHLTAGPDRGSEVGLALAAEDRFGGGALRLVESFQSALFAPEVRERFAQTVFQRGARANRMGVEMVSDGAGFAASGQLNILSEIIVPGDVQMTGDGKPFVLLREAQTTGGYPRIGTVLPCDLPKVAQGQQGQEFRFEWIPLEDGVAIQAAHEAELKRLVRNCQPMVRDPADMQNLLAYEFISGVVSAEADPFETGETT